MLLGKIVLSISTLTFISYGLVSLFFPAIPADLASLTMVNGDAYAEIGAMYGGLQTGIGLFCALALLKPDLYRSGLLLLVLGIGALTLARLASMLTTQDPLTAYSYGALVYELGTTLLALVAVLRQTR